MGKNIVTVTGGTGYIASWIVKDLLEQGHIVRITVRDRSNTAKYQHLLDIEQDSNGTLEVFQSDLLVKGSFDQAVNGADYVMHTASPFFLDDKGDTQKKLVDPAVDGTVNLLEAVNRSGSVKRVVLTSSLAAIYGDNQDLVNNNLEYLDETVWNKTSSLTHNAYSYSKTMAEKAAWEIAKKQDKWDLVTIHPGFVLGPSLTKRVDSTSINTILRILRGELKSGAPDLGFIFSDVRDISSGHILAAFNTKASGRYIIANDNGNLLTIGKIIDTAYPGTYNVPKNSVPKFIVWLLAPIVGFTRKYVKNNIGYSLNFKNTRSINELDIKYHTLNDCVVDHVEQIRKDNLI
ncbi:MAG: NAD-dependent epimerase/dehydratase family protein [Spirochaetaceae bacterium]